MDSGAFHTHSSLASLQSADETIARNAFAAIFRHFYHSLCRFALIYLPPDTAEDAVCEVFAQLWLRRASLTVTSTLDAYLFGAVRHRALKMLRGTRRASTWAERFKDTGEYPAVSTVPLLADAVLEMREERRTQIHALQGALATLSPRSRQILLLRWSHQLSFTEIAEVLETTPGAAQTQVSRALRALRERLTQLGM